jgi:hypothetical protein
MNEMITVAVGTVHDNWCADFAWFAPGRSDQVGVYTELASLDDVCAFVTRGALVWNWAPLRLEDGRPVLTLIRNGEDFSLVGEEVSQPHNVRKFGKRVWCEDCDVDADNIHELASEPCRSGEEAAEVAGSTIARTK